MKRWKTIGLLLFVAVLAACNPREARRMEAALEEAWAVYGDGSLEVEVDTVLFIPGLSEAPAYFAGRKQYHKAALAALLNGYTERDFDKEAAMASFKDAERYGEKARDSLTVARAEYWIGKFLIETGRKEDALSVYLTSSKLFDDNCAEKAYIENGLAVIYMLKAQFDSASCLLQTSLVRAQNNHLDKMERKTLNNFAVLYRIQGEYDQALNCIRATLAKPDLDDIEKTLAYLNLGKTFCAEGVLDSAAFYYQQMESVLQVANVKDKTKVSAYGALIELAEKQGNDSLALKYREKHEDALYDVMSQRQEQAVYRIQKQYDYEALRSAMSRKIIQRHRIILAFSVLLLFFAVIIIIQQHRHKQMLDDEENMKQQLVSMKEDLSRMVDISVLDALVVAQLKTIIAANRAKNRAKDPQNEWRPLFLEVMGGKEKTFEAAKEVVESAYPGLYSLIPEKYPDLSETETGVCLLSCFDLTNSQIAELLNLKTNTVNQARTSLRKKLNLNSEKLNEQLRKLVSK